MELAFHPLSFASILLKSPFLAGLGERPKRECSSLRFESAILSENPFSGLSGFRDSG
jgi:hypothetical protein